MKKFIFVVIYICIMAMISLGVIAGLEYYAYQKVKSSQLGLAYANRDMDLARRSSQTVAPQYGYEPTPGFASVRNTKLGNSFEYINEESFKDVDSVPREKPSDEYRVIVTGGSVVYGRGPVPPADVVCDFYEVTYRWTIPHIIEKLMNSDPEIRRKIGGKTVRVINAGVAGFVYQNNLMRYLAKLRLYQPDLLIALDGANEVHTVARPLKDWNYFTEGPYFEVVTEVMDMSKTGLINYLTLWLKRNTYFFTWLAMSKGEGPGILMENRGFAAHPQDPTPEMLDYLNNNIGQVADVATIYHRVLETDKTPHVFALQPMFKNSKKKRTPLEQEIEKVTGMDKIGFYDSVKTYDTLVSSVIRRAGEDGFEIVDLTTIFDSTNEWVFTDWCHLTNGANFIMAKALVGEVKKRVFGLPLTPFDKLAPPLDSYFTDYARIAKVLVEGKPTDAGLNILKGYPSENGLEVKIPGAKVELTLDIEKVVPISRLRIVWGSGESTPEKWKLEVSEDGASWRNWLVMENNITDHFDQWPGYEYYADQETNARYVRYTQISSPDKLFLRQISLFR